MLCTGGTAASDSSSRGNCRQDWSDIRGYSTPSGVQTLRHSHCFRSGFEVLHDTMTRGAALFDVTDGWHDDDDV